MFFEANPTRYGTDYDPTLPRYGTDYDPTHYGTDYDPTLPRYGTDFIATATLDGNNESDESNMLVLFS